MKPRPKLATSAPARHTWTASALVVASLGCPGPDAPEDPAGRDPAMPIPTGRLDADTCRLSGTAPESLPRLTTEPLGGQPFADVQALVFEPGGRLLVAEAAGRVWAVYVQTQQTTLVADLRDRVDSQQSRGLLAIAPTSAELFVHYHRADDPLRTRVARMPLAQTVDVEAETTVLEQLHASTTAVGGGLAFDAAGMLIVGLGDGHATPPANPWDSPARDRLDPRGSILRVDVSAGGAGYAIPPDNPYVDDPEADDALLAWGFHDPRHCTSDPEAGIWCTDAGSGQREELDRIGPGDYGWPIVEGWQCVDPTFDCDASLYVGPHANYGLEDPDPAIELCELRGGALYPGHAEAPDGIPGLAGAHVFGDRCSGRVWGLRTDVGAGAFEVVAAVESGVSALAASPDGDLIVVDGAGQLARLVVASDGAPGSLPTTLSATGCFTDPASVGVDAPAPELISFQVASALWSDDASKHRQLWVPPGESIHVAADGAWTLPEGSLVIKTFGFDGEVGPVETRFMRRRNGVWEFHSYRWRDDASDADLLGPDDSHERDLDDERTWRFPTHADCRTCHGFAAGQTLGLTSAQIDREVLYRDGETIEAADQLATLDAIGLLSFAEPATEVAALTDPRDTEAALEARVRSYFAANCAHCHNPSWVPPDLRIGTPLAETGLCDLAEFPSPWPDAERRVAPGDPERSNLIQRMRARSDGQMPPLGTDHVDPLGLALAEQWVAALESCD